MDNKILIEEKLAYLKSLLKKIEYRLEKYDIEKDESERETLFAAMSKFSEEVIETAIKINNILLEEEKDFAPTYYETFTRLLKYYDIDKDLISNLAKTTGFRNRISHEYSNLDSRITIESFNNLLNLYPKYIDEIRRLVNSF